MLAKASYEMKVNNVTVSWLLAGTLGKGAQSVRSLVIPHLGYLQRYCTSLVVKAWQREVIFNIRSSWYEQ